MVAIRLQYINVSNQQSEVLVTQSYPTVCVRMDFSPQGSYVNGFLQARILEWVAIPFSWGTSLPRDWTQVSCIVGRFFTDWTTREAHQINMCELNLLLHANYISIKRITLSQDIRFR